jgi:hypothetical protein
MPGKEPDFLKNGSPEMRRQVKAVIDKLYGTNVLQFNELLEDLLSKLLSGLISGAQEAIDLSNFSPEEIQMLLAALKEAIEQIGKSGGNDEKLVKALLQHLVVVIAGIGRQTQEDLSQINEKKQREIRELLNKIMNYENYKTITPRHIAGESRLQRAVKDLPAVSKNIKHKPPHGRGGPGMGM